jgi:hypothetical protein
MMWLRGSTVRMCARCVTLRARAERYPPRSLALLVVTAVGFLKLELGTNPLDP